MVSERHRQILQTKELPVPEHHHRFYRPSQQGLLQTPELPMSEHCRPFCRQPPEFRQILQTQELPEHRRPFYHSRRQIHQTKEQPAHRLFYHPPWEPQRPEQACCCHRYSMPVHHQTWVIQRPEQRVWHPPEWIQTQIHQQARGQSPVHYQMQIRRRLLEPWRHHRRQQEPVSWRCQSRQMTGPPVPR